MDEYDFYFDKNILFTEFKIPIEDGVIEETYSEIKENFPNRDMRFHMWKDGLGYWHAYDHKHLKHVYCRSLRKLQALKYIKEYLDEIENCSNK